MGSSLVYDVKEKTVFWFPEDKSQILLAESFCCHIISMYSKNAGHIMK